MLEIKGENPMKKSMWEQPGGKLGMVMLVGLGAGALIFLYRILPFLIQLAENALHLGML